ncbi:enoyl-CoA hydratase/isomerase family protein [soil metagenome]
MHLEADGPVQILHLDETENRFNPTWLAEFDGLLDQVEAAADPVALVIIGSGKFWSNGLDLEWMTANPDEISSVVGVVQSLYARVLSLPIPTVAALHGHTFAAGAMLALACDARIMREDRGFFCLPEVDIRIPFTNGMAALIQAKLTKPAAHQAMAFGRRFGGADALTAQIVDAVAGDADLRARAVAFASELAGKYRATLSAIKRTMYAPALAALAEPAASISLPTPPAA